jgi:hypothetical protein
LNNNFDAKIQRERNNEQVAKQFYQKNIPSVSHFYAQRGLHRFKINTKKFQNDGFQQIWCKEKQLRFPKTPFPPGKNGISTELNV